MKITKAYLKKIIKEELGGAMGQEPRAMTVAATFEAQVDAMAKSYGDGLAGQQAQYSNTQYPEKSGLVTIAKAIYHPGTSQDGPSWSIDCRTEAGVEIDAAGWQLKLV